LFISEAFKFTAANLSRSETAISDTGRAVQTRQLFRP